MNRVRLVVAATSLVLAVGAATAVAVTRASWTDETYVQARATAGTWETGDGVAYKCESVDTVYPDATCTVQVRVPNGWDFWGTGYQVGFSVVTTHPQPFRWRVVFDLDEQAVPPVVSTGFELSLDPAPYPLVPPGPGHPHQYPVDTPRGIAGYQMFPGYPVPADLWWSQWTPERFQLNGLCAASNNPHLETTQGEVVLRGVGQGELVSATSPVNDRYFRADYYSGDPLQVSPNAPACAGATQTETESAIVCYRAHDPVDTDACQVNAALSPDGTSGYRVDFSVSTPLPPSTAPFVWEALFDLSKSGYPPPDGEIFPPGPLPAQFASDNLCVVADSVFPVLRIRGSQSWNQYVGPAQAAAGMDLRTGEGGGPLSSLPTCGPLPVLPVVDDSIPAVSCRIPTQPTAACVATAQFVSQWGGPPITDWQRAITIETDSGTPVAWELTINLSHSEFPALANSLSNYYDWQLVGAVPSCSSSPRVLTFVGNPGFPNRLVPPTQTFQLQGSSGAALSLATCAP